MLTMQSFHFLQLQHVIIREGNMGTLTLICACLCFASLILCGVMLERMQRCNKQVVIACKNAENHINAKHKSLQILVEQARNVSGEIIGSYNLNNQVLIDFKTQVLIVEGHAKTLERIFIHVEGYEKVEPEPEVTTEIGDRHL